MQEEQLEVLLRKLGENLRNINARQAKAVMRLKEEFEVLDKDNVQRDQIQAALHLATYRWATSLTTQTAVATAFEAAGISTTKDLLSAWGAPPTSSDPNGEQLDAITEQWRTP